MKLREWGAFILLGLVWGSSFLWIKVAVQEIGPVTLVALRLLIGSIGLLAVGLIWRPSFPRESKVWLALLLIGITNTVIPFVLISWGEVYIDSGVAAIVNGTVPLFTILIAHVFLHDDRITMVRGFGLLMGFVGVVVLMGRNLGLEGFQKDVLGQVAVVIASISYAASAVFTRRNLRRVSPIVQALVSVVVADGIVWMMVPVFESPFRGPDLPVTWVALVWLGLLGSCLAYLLYFYLIQNVGATRASMVTYLMPVVGVALGVIFLKEHLDWQLAVGTMFVGGSVWIVNSGQLSRLAKKLKDPDWGRVVVPSKSAERREDDGS